MSSGIPSISGRDALRALERAGFFVDRVKGSHHIMAHKDDPARIVIIPVHGNRDLKRGTLRGVIKQADLTIPEFIQLL